MDVAIKAKPSLLGKLDFKSMLSSKSKAKEKAPAPAQA
jgi:hypothetical protein